MKTLTVTLTVLGAITLSACTPPDRQLTPAPSQTQGTGLVVTPTPTQSVSTERPGEATYEAEIADWADPLPPGYAWPSFTELPDVGRSQLADGQNATGIYRCMLIEAAWNAYFEADDSDEAREYAIRADAFVDSTNPSFFAVTAGGEIVASQLASANGICFGMTGELRK